MKNTIHTHEDRLTNTNRDIERVTCMQRELVDDVDIENQTRRNNLRIDGVAELTLKHGPTPRQSPGKLSSQRCAETAGSTGERDMNRTCAQSGRIKLIGPT